MKSNKFYINYKVNSLTRENLKTLEKNQVIFERNQAIPEGDHIVILEGIISQNYPKGEVSRNGYKYLQDGWVLDSYSDNPIILWQHEDNFGGIGFMQELYIDKQGNLAGVFFIDTNTLSEQQAHQVRGGYVRAVSTGAITLEDAYEEIETGELYTEEEAIEKFGFENVLEALWRAKDRFLNYVVTKAELLENSLVSIGSNHKSFADVKTNNLQDEMKNKAETLKTKMSSNDETLLPNVSNMKDKKELKVDTTKTTPETNNTPEVIEDKVELNEVETLTNKLQEVEKNFAEYKEKSENDLKELKADNKALQNQLDEKTKLLDKKIKQNAPQITQGQEEDEMTLDTFKDKWSK